jgi:hypothetical protein
MESLVQKTQRILGVKHTSRLRYSFFVISHLSIFKEYF